MLPGHDLISATLAPAFADSGNLPRWADQLVRHFDCHARGGPGLCAPHMSLYRRAGGDSRKTAPALRPLRALLLNAYYVDTIYHWLFEVPALTLASRRGALHRP